MTEVYRPDDAGGEYEVVIRLRIPRDTPVGRIVTADLEAQAAAASILYDEPSPRDD